MIGLYKLVNFSLNLETYKNLSSIVLSFMFPGYCQIHTFISIFPHKLRLLHRLLILSSLFTVLAWKWLLSAGLKPILSDAEKMCIISQTTLQEYKNEINKTVINLIIFYFTIQGKLAILWSGLCFKTRPNSKSPIIKLKLVSNTNIHNNF